MDRKLPDEELHDLYKQLAVKWDEICAIHTKIYEHVELKMIHEETIRKIINKGTTLIDILQVTAMFTLFIVPFLLAKLWIWVWFWVFVLGGFAAFELISYLTTGRSISQLFGKYKRENPKKGWLILLSMALGWGCLLWHLL